MGRADGNGKGRRTPPPRVRMPVSGSPESLRPERRTSPVPEWVTILVVDDEAPIRQVLVDLLGNFGYHTVEAESALWDAGLTHAQRKARRDKVAAQILLQSYIDAGCPPDPTSGPLDDPP